MQAEHISEFLPIACVGFGLFLVGGVNLLLLRRRLWIRLLATLGAIGIALGSAAALDHSGLTARTARILVSGLLPCLLLSSRQVTTGTSALLLTLQQRRAVRFVLLTVSGIVLSVGSVVVFERADEEAIDASSAELAAGRGRGETAPIPQSTAVTDKGTSIVLKEATQPRDDAILNGAEERMLHDANLCDQVIHRGPATDHSNCHGWVFTHGQAMLDPDDVVLILAENGYVAVHEPEPGDLAVYSIRGQIAHTAIVRYVTEGQPVMVEGKWGAMGVFLHPADKSPYGTDYIFYRSHRQGHLLAGISDTAPAGGPASATATE
jgi:hypothetical protein